VNRKEQDMPKVDFANVDDVQDFSPLPDGKYLCMLADLEEGSTRHGDEMWRLKFQVAEGEYKGRYVFDNLVFSDSAMKRVKLVCSRLGIDVSGEVDLTPDMLLGKMAVLTLEQEEYEDNEGRVKRRNTVPFAGYARAPGEEAAAGSGEEGEEKLPF
jgi:hypothetical protein